MHNKITVFSNIMPYSLVHEYCCGGTCHLLFQSRRESKSAVNRLNLTFPIQNLVQARFYETIPKGPNVHLLYKRFHNFPGDKVARHSADHPPLYSVEPSYEYTYTLTPACFFMACVGVNFTCSYSFWTAEDFTASLSSLVARRVLCSHMP